METQSYSSEQKAVQGINRLNFHNEKKYNNRKNKNNRTENKYNKPNNQDKSHLNLHIHKNQMQEPVNGVQEPENKPQGSLNLVKRLVIPNKEQSNKLEQPVEKKQEPVIRAEQPLEKKQEPVIRVEQPLEKKQEPVIRVEQPVEKKQEQLNKIVEPDIQAPGKNINFHQNTKILINQKLKDNFSVSEAKYDENCKCGKSSFAEVTFHDLRKKLYKNDRGLFLNMFEYVIVQVESGTDVGTVTACGTEASEKLRLNYHNETPEYSILKHAVIDDLDKVTNNNIDEFSAIEVTRGLVTQYNLDMKITDAEWQLDRQRLTLYFTAPQRIDFRDLVKELARLFKTRIELRQISTREEARRIGGMGPCGLNLCCSSFVSEFCHVTLDHARDQHLSNNIAKLSGYCGRLKCCLLYEHDIYVEVYDKFPPLHSKVKTPEGLAVLNKIDVFKETAQLYYSHTGVYRYMKKEEIMKLWDEGKITPPAEEEIKAKEKEIFSLEDLSMLECEF